MPYVKRKDINSAKKLYRQYRQFLKRSFEIFIGLSPEALKEYHYGNDSKIYLTPLGAAKVNAFLYRSPERLHVLLKIAQIKYENVQEDT